MATNVRRLTPVGKRGKSGTVARFRPGPIPASVKAQGQAAVYRRDGYVSALGRISGGGGSRGGSKS